MPRRRRFLRHDTGRQANGCSGRRAILFFQPYVFRYEVMSPEKLDFLATLQQSGDSARMSCDVSA
jgi:hypothetical protein